MMHQWLQQGSSIHFAEPMWLLVGAITVVALFALLVRAERKRSAALVLLQGARLLPAHTRLPSRFRRWMRVAVVTFAAAMGFSAIARPQVGMHWETSERTGVDVLLVVDTSKSMDVDDVKPTRLERTKLAITDLVAKFPGDRVGLVAFAGDAISLSPLTLDHDALLQTVDALDTATIARGGTNIGRAIDVATAALRTEPGRQKTMILLTDGEDLEGQGLSESKKAQAEGIVIDAVGVGSTNGDLVPSRDDRGRITGVVRDETGAAVRSKLDEDGLRAIAAASDGSYRALGVDGRGLDHLYAEEIAPRAHVELAARTHRVYSEKFAIPLLLALIALLGDAALGLPWPRFTRKSRSAKVLTTVLTAAVATAFLFAPRAAHASVSGAEKAYAAGKFDEAAKQYEEESLKNPKDARLAFNAGDAAYRSGHYDAALNAWKRAVPSDPKLRQHVFYNEGDALYRAGEAHVEDARAETIKSWKESIASYEGALALEPTDADARFNRDFVKKKLAELEEKQKQDEKKKDDDKKKQGDSKSSDDKSGKGDSKSPDDKSGKGDSKSPDDKSGKGDSKSPDGKSGKGDQGKQNDKPNGTPSSPGQAPPQPTSPQAGNGTTPKPGELSPNEARALLSALRGEEHHGAVRAGSAAAFDADAGAATNEPPRKDW